MFTTAEYPLKVDVGTEYMKQTRHSTYKNVECLAQLSSDETQFTVEFKSGLTVDVNK